MSMNCNEMYICSKCMYTTFKCPRERIYNYDGLMKSISIKSYKSKADSFKNHSNVVKLH